MKKAQIKGTMAILIIIILTGMIYLIAFFVGGGHLPSLIKQVPELLNDVSGEIKKRSPEANTLYLFSDLHQAYELIELNLENEGICRYELSSTDRNMPSSYIEITKKNNNLLMSLNQESDDENLNPQAIVETSNLCVVEGEIANELQTKLSDREGFLGWVKNLFSGAIGLDNSPRQINDVKIIMGSNGVENFQYAGNEVDEFKISKYMLFDKTNNQMCFIPLRDYHQCKLQNGVLSTGCENLLSRLKRC